LRTPTDDVTVEVGREIGRKLGEILVNYRKIAGIGRGLAAPQIGIAKSVFVTYLDDKLQTYINPKIVVQSDEKNYYRELCLSSGIMWADVERSETITMEWLDESEETHSQEVNGFMARLFQHEESHLRGRPNLDDAVPGTIEVTTRDPLK
ncbi:MAG: peptide deformylase, partial [bacterium]|nr:peptide deformylase [bacterium]